MFNTLPKINLFDNVSYNVTLNFGQSVMMQMLAVFNDTEDFMAKLTECLDPNLTRYHKDSMLQVCYTWGPETLLILALLTIGLCY